MMYAPCTVPHSPLFVVPTPVKRLFLPRSSITPIRHVSPHAQPRMTSSPQADTILTTRAQPALPPQQQRVRIHDTTNTAVVFSNFDEHPHPAVVQVTGQIPYYLHQSTYYRVGPARFEETHSDGTVWKAEHLFDAVSMVSSFRFNVFDSTVTFRSRINSPKLLDAIRQTPGSWYRNFRANANNKPMWQQLLEWRPPAIDFSIQLPYTNYVVGLEHIPGQGLCSRTDVAAAQVVHPRTLAPLRQFRFSELHPKLDGAASLAHGMSDEKSGDYFNVVWSYKPGTTEYHVFCTNKSGETRIVASFSERACYMHSASFTDNYIIVTLAPIRINFSAFLLSLSIGNSFEVVDDENVKFVVISRNGGVVRTFTHDTFAAMHSITAFEQGDDVVLDWCGSRNAKEMLTFDMEDLKRKAKLPDSSVIRFTLPNVRGGNSTEAALPRAHSNVVLEETGDFPVICAENDYRYLYMTKNSEGVMSGVVQKFDMSTGECKTFGLAGCILGEMSFAKNPAAKAEDDGCLVLVALDTVNQKSMLLVLDAHRFEEVARADLPVAVPSGLHGYLQHS
eukprot:TRINITY_DN107_c0_g2_i1.p2 TRINITY_DN107_c0_g2~~TRINITY_DN107_c0_g2_i1.p2  ORF type:complete len:561 (-),score=71.07 TRINITY_DN107_c0_g2_i1:9657-11339(-)